MRAKRPYRFRLLHVVDALAAIGIAAIVVGLVSLDLPWISSRINPLPMLLGFGLFIGYLTVRANVLTKL